MFDSSFNLWLLGRLARVARVARVGLGLPSLPTLPIPSIPTFYLHLLPSVVTYHLLPSVLPSGKTSIRKCNRGKSSIRNHYHDNGCNRGKTSLRKCNRGQGRSATTTSPGHHSKGSKGSSRSHQRGFLFCLLLLLF